MENKVTGTFFILRHLKKYSIWIDESDSVYGVVGISEPVGETLSMFRCPMAVKAVLIPFKNQLIYDSLLVPYNVHFGGNIRKQLNEVYAAARESKSILTAF